MTKKEKREREERKQQIREIRRKVVADFWYSFTKHFRPWLYELTEKYKERGDFPLMSAWLLPSYYTDPKDIEIAAIASKLIKDDDKLLQRVEAFRELMGECPSDWYYNREFVYLSMGKTQEQRTAGVLNVKIAEFFSNLYDRCKEGFSPLCGCDDDQERLIRLVLGTSGGFGKGVWTIMPYDLKCPLTKPVMSLLRTFFPDYARMHNIDDAINLFGFEKDCDFFYAALAYQELQRRKPKECSRLATVFQKRYSEENMLSFNYWGGNKAILPKIDF